MRVRFLLIAVAAVAATTFFMLSYNQKVRAEEKPYAFGACYTLFNCEGGSIGVFTDEQCRAMGGHSMLNGGICIELN